MLKSLAKHRLVNQEVQHVNRVKKCVEEAMEASTWAEVFAAVSSLAMEDLVDVHVVPFATVPSAEGAAAFEEKWPGATVMWFERQMKDAVTAEGNPNAAQNQNPPL